ncbi:MAG: hypothetical protein HOC71_18055 [Candidatus Latescibacteria bacterium]|jgi:hypothetical protein|nr:hypothetical protein [Candidatus Latescibacterota bacterium]
MRFSTASLLCVITLLGGSTADSQLWREIKSNINMTGYVTLSANWIDIELLNDRIGGHGYPVFKEFSPAWGGGSRMIFRKKFIVGFDYFNLINKRESLGSYDSSLSGSMRLLCLGICVVNRPDLQIYPLVSIGTQKLTLKLTQNPSLSFDDIMENPDRGVEIDRRDILIDLGLQFDKFRYENETRVFLWGMKAGYRFIPGGFGWQYNRSSLEDGPDAGIEGPYVQLNAGMRNLIRAILRK